jgi:hypothetical protein
MKKKLKRMLSMIIVTVILIGTITITEINMNGEKPPLQGTNKSIFHVI